MAAQAKRTQQVAKVLVLLRLVQALQVVHRRQVHGQDLNEVLTVAGNTNATMLKHLTTYDSTAARTDLSVRATENGVSTAVAAPLCTTDTIRFLHVA